jgi:hypothetical protein
MSATENRPALTALIPSDVVAAALRGEEHAYFGRVFDTVTDGGATRLLVDGAVSNFRAVLAVVVRMFESMAWHTHSVRSWDADLGETFEGNGWTLHVDMTM